VHAAGRDHLSLSPERLALDADPSPSARGAARVILFPAPVRRAPELSARERACLEMTAHGLEPGEIAKRITATESTFVAEETVKSCQRRAIGKLGGRSLAHAVAIALERRLIRLDE